MKKLLIIGDGDIHINQSDVASFGIDSLENLTIEEFNSQDNLDDCIIMKGLVETSDFYASRAGNK